MDKNWLRSPISEKGKLSFRKISFFINCKCQ
jgi:hypothetical protein